MFPSDNQSSEEYIFGPTDPKRQKQEERHCELIFNNPPLPVKYQQKLIDFVSKRQCRSKFLRSGVNTAKMIESLKLPRLLMETPINVGDVNKIFASAWINSNQVLVGTKCNQLLVIDPFKKRVDVKIDCLKSSIQGDLAMEKDCGIHAIDINPSSTMLATGADQANNLAVYSLPSMQPLYVGEGGHRDWIFDMLWLDDQTLLTGGRDGILGTWNINNNEHILENTNCQENFKPISVFKPSKTINLNSASITIDMQHLQRIRSLAYNHMASEVCALTLSGNLHLFDVHRLCRLRSVRLPMPTENVVIEYSTFSNVYAVGSKSRVFLYDSREKNKNKSFVHDAITPGKETPVRSIAFRHNLMSLGMGKNTLTFMDLRNGKYFLDENEKIQTLRCSDGYFRDCDFHFPTATTESINALYTQKWDINNSHLFIAGGPLPATIWGNTSAILR